MTTLAAWRAAMADVLAVLEGKPVPQIVPAEKPVLKAVERAS